MSLAKVELNDIGTLANGASARQALNDNFQKIEDEFKKVVYRDGSTPNSMEADLDLNSHRVLNVANAVNDNDAVNKGQVADIARSVAESIAESVVEEAWQSEFDELVDHVEDELSHIQTKLDSKASTSHTHAIADVSGLQTALDAKLGASSLVFKQEDADAVERLVQDKLRDVVSVKDFGAVGDGITDDSAAILAAISALQTNSEARGRTLFFPAGHYRCPVALDFTSYLLIHGIYIEGEGDTNTIIDFAGAPAGTDGITFGNGAHFGVRKIMVTNAPRHNIVVGRGTTVGGPSYASMFTIECVRSQNAGQDGIYIQNAYLGRLSDIWARACGRNGITLAGFHTAIHAARCESSNNTSSGWAINGLVYGTFEACGSDENGLHGWALSNVQGVTLNACGSESNRRAGFYLFTSDTSATGLVTQSSNIRGVEFIGCYALNNSLDSAGTYGTFIQCVTNNSRPAAFAIRGGVAHGKEAADRALVLTASSGSILCIKDGFDDAAFLTGDSLFGAVEVQNRTMTGRRCMVGITAQQSIPNNTETTINVLNSASPVANDLGAAVSTTGITIPRGVNKVIVSASFGWEDTPATGVRMFKVFKNGAGFAGMPSLYLNDAVYTLGTIRSAPISVSPGDVFSLVAWQNSGAALNTLGPANGVWFCVEAVS